MNNESEIYFFKNGDYDVEGGFFVRSEIKEFINKLIEAGHDPVGIKVDLESHNVEVLVAAK
jgi:hypothetical protein